MIVPVRCFTCGKVIADKYDEYVERVSKKENPEKVLDELGLDRYCCRRTIFSHVDLMDEVMKYNV
jgi:DNA-directed RNA polymerase subunit N